MGIGRRRKGFVVHEMWGRIGDDEEDLKTFKIRLQKILVLRCSLGNEIGRAHV